MRISKQGREFIKSWETLHDGGYEVGRITPKLDPANIWTEGYGHLMTNSQGQPMTKSNTPQKYAIQKSQVKTIEDAEKLFRNDVRKFQKIVREALSEDVNTTQNQFDALVSHCFNTGTTSETIYMLVNDGADFECKELETFWKTTYTTSNGARMRGLEVRRKQEWEMFAGIVCDYSKFEH